MNPFEELEKTLLDQIEKLNDDSICSLPEDSAAMVERSKAMSQLTGNFIAMNQLKLNIVKTAIEEGLPNNKYDKFLGVE